MRTTETHACMDWLEVEHRIEEHPIEPVNPLNAEQKFYLLMALILSVPFTAALYLVGRAAIIGAVVMLLLFWGYKQL